MEFNPKSIAIMLILCALSSAGTWFVAKSSSTSSSQAVATAAPSAEAVAKLIAEKPELCPKAEVPQCPKTTDSGLVVPSDEEATIAFRNRPNPLGNSGESNDQVKLGSCYKGAMTEIQCGADVDFGGNGKWQQRQIGFTKTPTGWMSVLF